MPPSRRYQKTGVYVSLPKKARNSVNQSGLDHLNKLHSDKISSNKNSSSSSYSSNYKNAIYSLAACPLPIRTVEDAVNLKGVGPNIGAIIARTYREKMQSVEEEAQAIFGESCSEDEGDCHFNNTTGPLAPLKRNQKRKDRSDSISNRNDANKRPRNDLDVVVGTTYNFNRSTSIASSNSVTSIHRTSSLTSSSSTTSSMNNNKKQQAYNRAILESAGLRANLHNYTNWAVILLLDLREDNRMKNKLEKMGIMCELRPLPIGDFLWIARGHLTGNSNVLVEVVLNHAIVERKSWRDLSHSLFGKRLDEQRLRLVEMSNIDHKILLVETPDTFEDLGNCPSATLRTTCMSTAIHLGFRIIYTRDSNHTMQFLQKMHYRILKATFPREYQSHSKGIFKFQHLPSHNKVLYDELKAKLELSREVGTKSISAIFRAMLKQLPTMSIKRVNAVTQKYPTPNALFQAYHQHVAAGGEKCELVQNLPTSKTRRIGPHSSKILASFFAPSTIPASSIGLSPNIDIHKTKNIDTPSDSNNFANQNDTTPKTQNCVQSESFPIAQMSEISNDNQTCISQKNNPHPKTSPKVNDANLNLSVDLTQDTTSSKESNKSKKSFQSIQDEMNLSQNIQIAMAQNEKNTNTTQSVDLTQDSWSSNELKEPNQLSQSGLNSDDHVRSNCNNLELPQTENHSNASSSLVHMRDSNCSQNSNIVKNQSLSSTLNEEQLSQPQNEMKAQPNIFVEPKEMTQIYSKQSSLSSTDDAIKNVKETTSPIQKDSYDLTQNSTSSLSNTSCSSKQSTKNQQMNHNMKNCFDLTLDSEDEEVQEICSDNKNKSLSSSPTSSSKNSRRSQLRMSTNFTDENKGQFNPSSSANFVEKNSVCGQESKLAGTGNNNCREKCVLSSEKSKVTCLLDKQSAPRLSCDDPSLYHRRSPSVVNHPESKSYDSEEDTLLVVIGENCQTGQSPINGSTVKSDCKSASSIEVIEID